MMMNRFDPDNDDFQFYYEDGAFGASSFNDFILADKLRQFHNGFDSSIRAILQECRFRFLDEETAVTIQILCPNEAVRKRLFRKREQIRRRLTRLRLDLDYYLKVKSSNSKKK